jgi:hypothetical protein
VSRRKRSPREAAAASGATGQARPAQAGPAPGKSRGRLAVDAGVLAAVFAVTVGIAELVGAANLGVAIGIGQVTFAIALVVLLVRE